MSQVRSGFTHGEKDFLYVLRQREPSTPNSPNTYTVYMNYERVRSLRSSSLKEFMRRQDELERDRLRIEEQKRKVWQPLLRLRGGGGGSRSNAAALPPFTRVFPLSMVLARRFPYCGRHHHRPLFESRVRRALPMLTPQGLLCCPAFRVRRRHRTPGPHCRPCSLSSSASAGW
jgi:hypothetical protein